LARLEVIATDEGLVSLGKLGASRDKSILRRAVDERDTLEDATDCKDGRRRNFGMALLDALQEIVGGIVNARNDVGIALGVSGPHDDDFVQSMLMLESPNVVANMPDMSPLVVARDQIVSAIRLIGGDEGGVVDGGKGPVLAEILGDLSLKIPVENLGTSHGGSQVKGTDVPSAENEIVGMDHGEDRVNGRIYVITMSIDPKFHGGRLSDAAVVIRFNQPVFIAKTDFETVGSDRGSQSTAIVTTPTNHHKTVSELAKIQRTTHIPDTRNERIGFEFVLSLCGRNNKLASLLGDNGIFINILGKNVIIMISDVIGRDVNRRLRGGFGHNRRFVSPRRGVVKRERRHVGVDERRQLSALGGADVCL
jgi:hypothetical protein